MQDYTKEELLNPQSKYYTDNLYALRPGETGSSYLSRTSSKPSNLTIDASLIKTSPSFTSTTSKPSTDIVNSVVDLTAPITGLEKQLTQNVNARTTDLSGTSTGIEEAKTGVETAQTNIKKIMAERPSQVTALETERAKYGIEPAYAEIQALLPDISSLRQQINVLNEQEARAIENLQGQGRGIPLDVLNTQANKISHEYAIRTNALASSLAAKTATMESLRGNITLANQLANQSVAAKMYDTDQKLKDWQTFYQNNKELYDSLSTEKKNILDTQYNALKTQADTTRAQNEKKASLMIQYPKAGITIDDTFDTIATKINANPYTSEFSIEKITNDDGSTSLVKINKGTGEQMGIISTTGRGAGAGTVDKPEYSYFKDAIESGIIGEDAKQRADIKKELNRRLAAGDEEGAREYLKRIAINGVPAEDRKKINGRVFLQEALVDLKGKLDEYVQATGDTNILRGSIENATQRIGQTTDPKLAALKQRIDNAYITYRSAMTGAQFSENESAEYRSILPDIKNSSTLNAAKIDAFLDILEINQRSLLKTQLGDRAYREIFVKPIEEARVANVTENLDSDYENYLKGTLGGTTQNVGYTNPLNFPDGGVGLAPTEFSNFFNIFK